MNYTLVLLFCTVLVYSTSDAYKLLVLFPFSGKSHGILGEGYVRHLTKAGHEVTYIASVPVKKTYPGLRQIDVSKNFEIYPLESYQNISKILYNEVTLSEFLKHAHLIANMMNATIHNEEVQKLMMDPKEQFDAVIAEWMYSEIYSGFSTVFGCPLIWSSSMDPHSMVTSIIDEVMNPAYVPDHTSKAASLTSFKDRVGELLIICVLETVRWAINGVESQIFAQGFGPAAAKRGHYLPPLNVVKYNGSLMFGNSHVSAGYPIRLPQNYKPIGGYHIEENTKPLPKEFQKIMDEATHGVIYFSMGSVLKSNQLPEEIKNGIVDVFRDLKQTVIWKFEEQLPGLTKNIHIVNWAPQQSILAHPNCVLFITHGGLLSITEALHFSVPMIGMPMFADQYNNVNKAVNKGFAKHVELNFDTPVNLGAAIRDMMDNPRYRDAMKQMSFVYHHRPASPGTELVHWVEHVIRTKGAPHLRSPALDVPFYQKMYLDLAALIVAILWFIKRIFKYLFKKNKVDANKKNE